MEFITRKIVRDVDNGNGKFSVRVVPTTSKIMFSTATRRKLGLEKKQIGFGYDPNAENATRACFYIMPEDTEDRGCVVSATGDTQNKFHSETLARIYNEGNTTSNFSMEITTEPENINGVDVYWLTSEDSTDTPQAEEPQEDLASSAPESTDVGTAVPDPEEVSSTF